MFLENHLQENLRKMGLITENEVVSQEGDLYVAINVLNSNRRILSIDRTLLEGRDKKILLKG